MKAKIILLATVVATLALTGCKSNKNVVTQEQLGNKEVELPCAKYAQDSEEYFGGMGVAENVNMQNARLAAINAAKSMINAKLGGLAKGISTDYVRTQAGAAQQDDVQRIAEREITAVIERMLNDAEQTCEKMYQTPNGTYQSHIAIRISKKELAKNMATALSDDQKLEGMFHRDQFRKWVEEYMKEYLGE
ncbi:MAG: hypothetical protein K5864_01430 [Bacteroidales bacterium]|nr:hypothetical protein [Bacteroidales bacterium]